MAGGIVAARASKEAGATDARPNKYIGEIRDRVRMMSKIEER